MLNAAYRRSKRVAGDELAAFTQLHSGEGVAFVRAHGFVVAGQDVVGAFVDLLDRAPAVDSADKTRRHPVAPLLGLIRLHVARLEDGVASEHDVADFGVHGYRHVPRRMPWSREHADPGQHFALAVHQLEVATIVRWLNAEHRRFVGAVVQRQRVVRPLDLDFGANVARVGELLHVLHVVPVQMREDDGVDLFGFDPKLLLQVQMHFATAALLAFVVVFGRARFVAEAGIDQDFVLGGFDIKAVHRVPDLLPGGAFPENISAQVGFEPTSVDGVDFAHGWFIGLLKSF